MPRGDGTGPQGAGPLNRSGRGSGMGRRRSLNGSGNCQRNDGPQRSLFGSQEPLRSGALLQGAVIKLIGLAAMAIPALLKARKQLQAPQNRVLIEKDNTGQPVIEIKPVHVEELEEHN